MSALRSTGSPSFSPMLESYLPMNLLDLGDRICILGPSNSGKSTLANAIACKLGCEAIHLDVLHHLPNTDWEPRPREEFVALHDAAITGALEGGRDSVKWDMIHHIAVVQPRNRNRYGAMFDALDLPKLRLTSVRAIKRCFHAWGLTLN